MTEKPSIKLLSATELVEQSNLFQEIDNDILTRGLKSTFPKNTAEEQAAIKSYRDDLRKVLSMERIALQLERSMAIIEEGKIKLTKRQGKWDVFESTGEYLEPHEALYLIELNRLEVYMGKMIVSLERAYHIFLAHDNLSKENEKLTKNEYVIYAHFMRFGCNIRRFKNVDYTCTSSRNKSDEDDTTQLDVDMQKSYIWNYLYELLGQQKTVIKSKSIDQNRYDAVKVSMNRTIETLKDNDLSEAIATTVTETSEKNPLPDKRKLSNDNNTDAPACKLVKIEHKLNTDDQYFGSGSTNDFMVGNSFQRFQHIFDKINYINVKRPNSYDNRKPINEKLTFDLWASLDHREPQFKGPDFRLLVRHPSKSLPNTDDIFRLYNSLIHKSAIVLICTNKEMSFQAYVYRFTT